MGRTAAVLALVLVGSAGCASPTNPHLDMPAAPTPLVFGAPILLSDAATEPDIAVGSSIAMVCALVPSSGSGGATAALVWASNGGGPFTPLAHPPAASGNLDCAVATDDAGNGYFADLAGTSVLVASTSDGRAWNAVTTSATGPGMFDRPWLLGGRAGHVLLTVQEPERGGDEAFATTDGGHTWSSAASANPIGVVTYQTNGNLARGPSGMIAFPFGVVSEHAPSFDARDLWVASSADGTSWSYAPVALGRGNIQFVFPAIAGDAHGFDLVWAELRDGHAGTQVYLSTSADAKVWSAPEPLNPDDTTALMPRVASTPTGPVVLYHEAKGRLDPPSQPGEYAFVAASRSHEGWREQVLSASSHKGTVSSGGYGSIPSELARGGSSSSNQASLLHTYGISVAPDGRVWAAWAIDDGGVKTLIAHT